MTDDLLPEFVRLLKRGAKIHVAVMDRIVAERPELLEDERFVRNYCTFLVQAETGEIE